MALTYNWILEHLEFASRASSVDEIRIRNSIVTQRIEQELRGGDIEPQQPPPRDTRELDAAWERLEQTAQRDDIDGQVKEDIMVVLGNLDIMYKYTRWGKK
jgi:hypothetical protein